MESIPSNTPTLLRRDRLILQARRTLRWRRIATSEGHLLGAEEAGDLELTEQSNTGTAAETVIV